MNAHELWILLFGLGLLLILPLILRSAWFKGRLGEFRIGFGLRLLLSRDAYRLIENVTLQIGDSSTQVDQIVLSVYGVFVIETKNRTGWIFGSPNDAYWTQRIYRHKNRFQNPLRQNYAHVKAVSRLLGLAPDQVHNVVVFVGGCTFKTPMPAEVVHGVFALARFIRSHRTPVLDEDELPGLVDRLMEYRLQPGWRTDRRHVRHVKQQARNTEPDAWTCPHCGGRMVQRTNKCSGERFLGCARYPRCKGTRSLR